MLALRASARRDGAQRESVRARKPKDVAALVESFRRLAAHESSAPTQSSRESESSWTSEEEPIIKQDWLRKLGEQVKSWHRRVFVLTKKGLLYFKDEIALQTGTPPLGRLRFCDMIVLTGADGVAAPLPRGLYALLGLNHVFSVHSESRTYVISAQSQKSQLDWVSQINRAHREFHEQSRLKDSLIGQIWRAGGDPHVFSVAQDLTKAGSSVNEVLNGIVHYLADQLSIDVAEARRMLWLRRTFAAWKAYRAWSLQRKAPTLTLVRPAQLAPANSQAQPLSPLPQQQDQKQQQRRLREHSSAREFFKATSSRLSLRSAKRAQAAA
jgi:hypothetical protein